MKDDLQKTRILIADGESISSRKLASYLTESGFSVKCFNNDQLIQKTILNWRPHVVFIDLMFPGFYAQNCLQFLTERDLIGDDGVRVIVTSKHNDLQNVMSCLKEGADDFLVKPLEPLEVLHRLLLLVKSRRFNTVEVPKKNESQMEYYFRIMDLLVKCTSQHKKVHSLRLELSQMLSLAVKAVRTSIIACNPEKTDCAVITSSDDPSLTHFPLQLEKYPEIQYLLRTEKPLFIENIDRDSTLSVIQERVKSIQFNSMIVLPLHYGSQMVGCLSIRMPEEYKKLAVWDVKVAQIAAQLVAMSWKFKPVDAKSEAA